MVGKYRGTEKIILHVPPVRDQYRIIILSVDQQPKDFKERNDPGQATSEKPTLVLVQFKTVATFSLEI